MFLFTFLSLGRHTHTDRKFSHNAQNQSQKIISSTAPHVNTQSLMPL